METPPQWALDAARDFLGDQPYALLIALAEKFVGAHDKGWDDAAAFLSAQDRLKYREFHEVGEWLAANKP